MSLNVEPDEGDNVADRPEPPWDEHDLLGLEHLRAERAGLPAQHATGAAVTEVSGVVQCKLRHLRHLADHLKGLDQNLGSLLDKVLRAGLTPADGDLELTRLDHPPSCLINQ